MSLEFVQNYQRIRQQFFTPRAEPVSPPRYAPIQRKKYVYAYPIGPIKPLWVAPKKHQDGTEITLHTPKAVADAIFDEVCAKHGVAKIELISARRPKKLTDIRQELYYRLATETTWSLPRIGRYLGGRDHTTVLHGKRQYEAKLMLGQVKL